jgi:hypothetical protein
MKDLMCKIIYELDTSGRNYPSLYSCWASIKNSGECQNFSFLTSDERNEYSRHFGNSDFSSMNGLKILALKVNLLMYCNDHKNLFVEYLNSFESEHSSFLKSNKIDQNVNIRDLDSYMDFICKNGEHVSFRENYIKYLSENIVKIDEYIGNKYSEIKNKYVDRNTISVDDEFDNDLFCLTPPSWWIDNIYEHILYEKEVGDVNDYNSVTYTINRQIPVHIMPKRNSCIPRYFPHENKKKCVENWVRKSLAEKLDYIKPLISTTRDPWSNLLIFYEGGHTYDVFKELERKTNNRTI